MLLIVTHPRVIGTEYVRRASDVDATGPADLDLVLKANHLAGIRVYVQLVVFVIEVGHGYLPQALAEWPFLSPAQKPFNVFVH